MGRENHFEETSTINPVCLLGKDKRLAGILLTREPVRLGMMHWYPDIWEASREKHSHIPVSKTTPLPKHWEGMAHRGLYSLQTIISKGPPSASVGSAELGVRKTLTPLGSWSAKRRTLH